MTDKEAKQLAIDIHEGRVFGTWSIDPDHAERMIPTIFMPVAMGAPVPEGTAHLYQYMDKANSRSVNGYPTFFSFELMDAETHRRVGKHIETLQSQTQAFLEGSERNDKV